MIGGRLIGSNSGDGSRSGDGDGEGEGSGSGDGVLGRRMTIFSISLMGGGDGSLRL